MIPVKLLAATIVSLMIGMNLGFPSDRGCLTFANCTYVRLANGARSIDIGTGIDIMVIP